MFLVVDEPKLGLRLVMLREPGAPFLPAGYIQASCVFPFRRLRCSRGQRSPPNVCVSRVRLRTSTAAHCWASCHLKHSRTVFRPALMTEGGRKTRCSHLNP